MNKTRKILALIFVFVLLLALSACKKAEGDLWADALYTEDTTLGDGATALTVSVKAGEKTVTFTVNTDETTVGNALLAVGLIAGETSQYGLYIKSVNGIVADYDVDQTYWAFYIDGEYAMSGVDATEIEPGAAYLLERTK